MYPADPSRLFLSAIIDKPKEDRQRKLAAETQRYSPWTGLEAGSIQEADPFGTALQFGMTGASMGAGMQKDAMALAKDNALIENMKADTALKAAGSGSQSNAPTIANSIASLGSNKITVPQYDLYDTSLQPEIARINAMTNDLKSMYQNDNPWSGLKGTRNNGYPTKIYIQKHRIT